MSRALPSTPPKLIRVTLCAVVLSCALVLVGTGCTGTKWIKRRRIPATPLAADLDLFSWRGPQPTARTAQYLRRNDLDRQLDRHPVAVLDQLLRPRSSPVTPGHVLAISEVAFINGTNALRHGREGRALDLFGVSVAHAYRYLLAPEFDAVRNSYDPQFRLACDLYNGALENVMRIVQRQGQLRPGKVHVAVTEAHEYAFYIQCRGPWHASEIEDLQFVSDYQLQGLKNHYRTFGLGVPLIGVHSRASGLNSVEQFYAPGMTMPITAFARVLPEERISPESGRLRHACVLELHDPVHGANLVVNGRRIPLQTDLSTPLAYALNDPVFKQANLATVGLLNPAKSQQHQGLYLLEPYDAGKIPVVMVHGLWSSLVTWMEMFNDLRGVPAIRSNFQFWFYLYPSGQPLLLSATQFRQELQQARQAVDPRQTNGKLDQMVLVGHSMGGLIARLQTLESGDRYWRLVSDLPVKEIDPQDEALQQLRAATWFRPNRSVARVVTIASPHHGSAFSNNATRWLGRRLINLPEMFEKTREQLMANQDLEPDRSIVAIQTSIDSLSPTSPILNVMQDSSEASWVTYHNIIGVMAEEGMLSKVAGQSDGVVNLESARLESASSELIVNADHINIHRHPKTVLEVQRILLEHLDQHLQGVALRRLPTPSDRHAESQDPLILER